MIEFAYPLMFLALIIPAIIFYFVPEYKERRASIQVPYFKRLINLGNKTPLQSAVVKQRKRIQWGLLVLSWVCLVIAMAKPQWVGEPIEKVVSARDILIAVDLSGSMSEKDFVSNDGQVINRLAAVKEVLTEFAVTRQDDRLGLIIFADAAYLQAPFTNNIDTWLELLNGMQLKMAGWLTAMGDAIGLSIKVFDNAKTDNKVLILLTDGTDTGSKMPPIKAAEIAAKSDIKIYTVAMGSPKTQGRVKLDLKALEEIANITGGQHYLAMDKQQLSDIYQKIGELETQEYKSLSYRLRVSLHHYPLMFFIIIYFLARLLVHLWEKSALKLESRGQR